MKILLDTHTVIGLAVNSSALSETAKQAIFDPDKESFVSIASAWEVAIKIATGKMGLDGGVSEFFRIVRKNNFQLLPIKEKHVKQVESLPLLHKDPFDRLLVASAITEGMGLITADANIHLYDVNSLW